ncbi:MAG: flagellar hook-length control protein FliK [Terricaulis sp.]
MDFASEPVLDAFPPPPTRAAPRAPVADDNGQTFGDHLDAVNEPPPERPAPPQQRTEAKDETPRVEAKASTGEDESPDHDDTIDVDAALLGGPLPAAPPPMAAPVAVQIVVASQSEQPPAQTAPQDADLNTAPVSAPQAPTPTVPAQEEAAAAQPADQGAQNTGKAERAADAPAQQQAQTAPQAPATQTPVATSQVPIAPTAPVSAEAVPEALQQTIAAATAPAPQAAAQPTTAQRTGKDAKQQVEAKAAAPDGEPKSDAPANVKTAAPKATSEGSIRAEAAPVLQTQSTAPDSSQIAQTNTIATLTTQANTHVQHAAAEAGAQRSTPVAAQVGREIVRKFSGGNSNFELRLDPADLGRVEVRMEVSRDNRVTAVITADNPQALAELARNARDLEQQLQSAGLQLSDHGLSFDLRQGAQGGESDGQRDSNARGESNTASATPEQQAAPLARPIGIDRWRGVRVDMMV